MSDVIESGTAGPAAPLLIMGSPRSGTKFLARMASQFFDVHICRDNGTLLRFHRNRSHYEPLADDANLRRLIKHLYRDQYFRERVRNRGMELSEAELFDRVRARTFGGLIEAVYSATAMGHGRRWWGYKRASLARVDGQHVEDLFPGARFVHIIRDARDVVLSMRKSTASLLEKSWHFGAVDWVSHVEAGRAIGRRMGPSRYLEVRYEQLMAEPAEVLSEVLTFWHRDAGDEERIARIRREIGPLVRSDNTDKWRRQMPPSAVRTIERVAGPLLGELGYHVDNPDVAGKPVSGPRLAWFFVDRIARNIFPTRVSAIVRYRMEVWKAKQRARFSDLRSE
jgi:hypothetical protein